MGILMYDLMATEEISEFIILGSFLISTRLQRPLSFSKYKCCYSIHLLIKDFLVHIKIVWAKMMRWLFPINLVP